MTKIVVEVPLDGDLLAALDRQAKIEGNIEGLADPQRLHPLPPRDRTG
jgi:hypothetical protein